MASTSVISLMLGPSQRVALLDERRRELREQVLEHRRRLARRNGKELGDGLLDPGRARFASRGLLGVAPKPFAHQVLPQARDWIETLRALEVRGFAIARGVVGGRVIAEPIGQGFDEMRSATLARFGERVLHDAMDG